MSDVSVKFTPDDAALWAALQKLIAQQGKVKDGTDGVGRSGRAAAAEMERFAAATKRLIASPLEKYEAHQIKLKAALDATKITQDEYNRAVAASKSEMDRATAAANKDATATAAAEASLKRFAEQTKRIVATPVENYTAEILKLDKALKADLITAQEHARALAIEKEHFDKARDAADKAGVELRQFAADTKNIIATPIEKYREQVTKLDQALKAKLLTDRQHGLAIAHAKTELDKSTNSARNNVSVGQLATSVGGRLVGQLTAVAASYLSIQAAAGLATRAMEDNVQLHKEAFDAAIKLAPKQEDAIKNLTGLSGQEKKDVLENTVLRIQKESGFPDRGQLTLALGAGQSASGNLAKTESAVGTAAMVTRGSPEKLPETAAGLLDLAGATGVSDAQQNASFLLQAGAINRITDLTKLTTNLAPLVRSGVNMVPGQEPKEASREVAAIFGVLARDLTDASGERAAQAEATLLAKTDEFFKERKEIDPGTHLERLRLLGKEPRLADEMWGEHGFGEEKAKPALRRLITGGTDAIEESKEKIGFDPKTFNDAAQELKTLTADLRLLVAKSKGEVARELSRREDQGIAGFSHDEMMTTLWRTKREGLVNQSIDVFKQGIAFLYSANAKESERPSAAMQALVSHQEAKIRDAFPSHDSTIGLAKSVRAGKTAPEDAERVVADRGVSQESWRNAQVVARVLDNPVLSDKEVAELPGNAKLRGDVAEIQSSLREIHYLVMSREPLRAPSTVVAQPAEQSKEWRPPPINRNALLERRSKLLAKAYDLDAPTDTNAIEFAERMLTDPNLAKLKTEGGLKSRLKQEGISPDKLTSAEKLVADRRKPELSETEISGLPGTESTRQSLRQVQQKLRETATPGTGSDESREWKETGAQLRDAAKQLTAAAQKLSAAKPPSPQPASTSPDYTSRARREQAFTAP